MGLAWQQGPLARGAIGTFLVPEPLPERLLYAERLRRRMRAVLGKSTIVQSDDVIVLHEPGRYPVAYFPKDSILPSALTATDRFTEHDGLGSTAWYDVVAGDKKAVRRAWEHVALPSYAQTLENRVAFGWQAMDAFYEEAERIVGHASDQYHRIDIRRSERQLVVHAGGRLIAETANALVLYESGFAPRWYVPAEDVSQSALAPAKRRTFCPYKGCAATGTSAMSTRQRGGTRSRIAKSSGSAATSPSSLTRSRSPSTASRFTPNPASRSSPTGPTAGSLQTR